MQLAKTPSWQKIIRLFSFDTRIGLQLANFPSPPEAGPSARKRLEVLPRFRAARAIRTRHLGRVLLIAQRPSPQGPSLLRFIGPPDLWSLRQYPNPAEIYQPSLDQILAEI